MGPARMNLPSQNQQRLRPFRPTPFGRYTLLMPLSSGGMGEVFLARLEAAPGFEKLCVVKKILPHLAANPQFVERFTNEAKTLARLSHGSIAQVLDMGEVDGEPFLAIEYVDGKDMRKVASRMRERGMPTPLTVVLYVMIRALDALAYAHRKRDDEDREIGLVHRDVSPQNILVSYEGEVKVIDFGLAKSSLNVGTTSPSIVLGKFLYMSPEQARNAKVDRRSDLYSVGLCLYELISGRNPFEELAGAELMAAVTSPKIPSLRTLDPLCPAEIEAAVMKALAVDPAHRYQSAEEFRGKLVGCLMAIDPSAGPESLSRFMRDTFLAEFQQERKLLGSLRESRRIAPPPSGGREVDTAVRSLHGPLAEAKTATSAAPPAGPPVLSPVPGPAVGAARTQPEIRAEPLSFAPTPRTHEDSRPVREGQTLPSIVIDDSLTVPALQAMPQVKRAELNWTPPSDLGPGPGGRTVVVGDGAVEERTDASVPVADAGREPTLQYATGQGVVMGTLLDGEPPQGEPPESRVSTHPDYTTSDVVPIALKTEVSFAGQTLPPEDTGVKDLPRREGKRTLWAIAVPLGLLTLGAVAYFGHDVWRSGLGSELAAGRPPPPGGRESGGDTAALPKAAVLAPRVAVLGSEPGFGTADESHPEPHAAEEGARTPPAVGEEGAPAPRRMPDVAPVSEPVLEKEFEPVAALPKRSEPRRLKRLPRAKQDAVSAAWRELKSAHDAVQARIGCGDDRVRRACGEVVALSEWRPQVSTATEADAFVQEARSLRRELRRKLDEALP